MSDNEIYLLIKYIKSVLWRVAKCLSYIEDARCLKVKPDSVFPDCWFSSVSGKLSWCHIVSPELGECVQHITSGHSNWHNTAVTCHSSIAPFRNPSWQHVSESAFQGNVQPTTSLHLLPVYQTVLCYVPEGSICTHCYLLSFFLSFFLSTFFCFTLRLFLCYFLL